MPGAMSISTTLRKAAQLQDKIEQLRGQLTALLVQARAEVEHAPVPLAVDDSSVAGTYARRPLKHKRARARTRPAATPSTARRGAVNGSGGSFGAIPAPGATKTMTTTGRTSGSRRRRGTSPLKGKKRNASPSGPLAPAVVKVLAAKGEPMHVRDILEGLKMANYQFTSTEPKKNLAARIYRLKGVRQVGEGLFAAS